MAIPCNKFINDRNLNVIDFLDRKCNFEIKKFPIFDNINYGKFKDLPIC
jgi:hypothetical protein